MGTDGDSVAEVSAYLDQVELCSPRGRSLPSAVQQLLPDLTRSLEDVERFLGRDLPFMSLHQCRHELAQLTVALADVVDFLDVPPWLFTRCAVLTSRLETRDGGGAQ